MQNCQFTFTTVVGSNNTKLPKAKSELQIS